MKIWLFKRNTLFFICTCLILLLSISFIFYRPFSFAIELSNDSVLNENSQKKMNDLVKQEEKIAYLTFDDGPTLRATGKILDILKEEEIKATFFIIGKYAEKHPDLLKREYEEGHYLANHGYDHSNRKLYQSEESFKQEIKKTDEAIGKAIGISNYCSHVFRFPCGFMSPNNKSSKKRAAKLLTEMNYVYVDWNCLNHDSVRKYSPSQLLANLKKSAKRKRNSCHFNARYSRCKRYPFCVKRLHYVFKKTRL